MKKLIIKTIYAILIFLAAIFVIDHVMNRESVDMTADMQPATFPLVYVMQGQNRINCMRGMVTEMDPAFVYEGVTPVDAKNRVLSFQMDAYDNYISGLAYEVRNTGGDRLVENGDITDFTSNNGLVSFSVTLKDLLQIGEEYIFRLKVSGGSTSTILYDTRICLLEQIENADQVIDFALDFSERTFDKERARELTTYLESNEEGDNTTFARVNIHSSFAQITWGSLEVRRFESPAIYLQRINPYVADVRLKYKLVVKNGLYEESYHVIEDYQLRFGKERLYLLGFDRTMNQIFEPHGEVFSNNKISLGITDPDSVQIVESEDGNVFAFVKENSLFAFNTSDNKTTRVFSFYDEDHYSERDTYDGNDIRILSIDETGNIRFLVRGYMNRGEHEGSVGVACYYYNSTLNTVEEEVYIPYAISAEYLKLGMGKLAYANSSNKLFILISGSLYRIDLTDKSYEVIQEGLDFGSYEVSEDKHLVAFCEESEDGKQTALKLLNLATGKSSRIEGPQGGRIKPLGFVGEDLVYGTVKQSDMVTDELGSNVLLISTVIIQDENGTVLKTYEKPGIYVTDATVTPSQITLERVVKNANGQIVKDADDYIMNDVVAAQTKNTIEVVATQNMEKIVQIAIRSSLSASKMKVLTPKHVLYEGQRQLFLENREVRRKAYYIYNVEGLRSLQTDAGEAIRDAEEMGGRVLDDRGRCIWEKSSRSRVHQIDTIRETAPAAGSSVAGCLDVMLGHYGANVSSQTLIERRESIREILSKNLPEHEVLNLKSCSLESVLYFVGRDMPVMALLNDGSAVLIVGYNEQNTILYNPITGKISKMGINDSTEFFAANGNEFITCVAHD